MSPSDAKVSRYAAGYQNKGQGFWQLYYKLHYVAVIFTTKWHFSPIFSFLALTLFFSPGITSDEVSSHISRCKEL